MARQWVAVDCTCGRRIGRVSTWRAGSPEEAAEIAAREGFHAVIRQTLGASPIRVSVGVIRFRCAGCGADTAVSLERFGPVWLDALTRGGGIVLSPQGLMF